MTARRPTLARGLLVVGSLTLGAMGLGCGGTGDSPSPSWAPASATPAPALVAVKRVVEQRNPFGNTSAGTNLVADGDFELTGRQDQMPWIVFSDSGQKTLDFDTGGRCRSGVRCAKIRAGDQLIGWMTSPHDGGIDVSVWAKPTSARCDDVEVRVLALEEQSEGAQLTSATPIDARGWCHFTGVAPNLANRSAVLYLTLKRGTKTEVLVDDAFATPAGLVNKTRAHGAPFLDATQQARVGAIATWLATHRRFGLPPDRLIDDPPLKTSRSR